jgi:hypothetical protein
MNTSPDPVQLFLLHLYSLANVKQLNRPLGHLWVHHLDLDSPVQLAGDSEPYLHMHLRLYESMKQAPPFPLMLVMVMVELMQMYEEGRGSELVTVQLRVPKQHEFPN